MNATPPEGRTAPSRVHPPCLAVGLTVVVCGTLDQRLMAETAGHADHGLAMLLFWATSKGTVRGVGFGPGAPVWRWLFSGWAVVVPLAGAAASRLMH